MKLLDHWLWPEEADGTSILVDSPLSGLSEVGKQERVQSLLADYETAVRVVEWQQYDTYPGFPDGPVNVRVQEWKR